MSGLVYIRSFGCQMNEYDSQKTLDILHQKCDLTPTDTIEDADLILLNTCSVREKAQSKVYDDLGRLRELKKTNPKLMIGVGGCVASQEGEAILKRAPFVDFIYGPQTLHRLPDMIAARHQTGLSQVDIRFPEIEKFDHLPPPLLQKKEVSGERRITAFVSIMEGCSKYCTFCVVPYTRGEEFSRPLDAVLTEIALLCAQGIREITLLGQNVNAWRQVHEDGSRLDFADLLACVHEMQGLERIRYMTSHPLDFSDTLIAAHRHLPKLSQWVHLPVQSGSDRVLAAMRRGYTALEYRAIIRKLREAQPAVCISSDFIVGFPGESEKDFNDTLALMNTIGFDQSYSFIYSPRPGTPAANMPDNVPFEEKQRRLDVLQELNRLQAGEISQQMIGRIEEVLIEGRAKLGERDFSGRTSNNRVVNFSLDEKTQITHPDTILGKMVLVKITEAKRYTLRGEFIGMKS